MTPESRVNSNIIYGPAASHYADLYSKVSGAYIVSETGIMAALVPHLENVRALGTKPTLLEIAAGQGLATLRMVSVLAAAGLDESDYKLISTEYSEAMIAKGKAERASHSEPVVRLPELQVAAECLPFPNESVDAVFGSQGIHWFMDIEKSLQEAKRVLRPGGMVVHASSGILEGYGNKHFTEHPAYKEWLKNVRAKLTDRGLWKEENGEFEPKNRAHVNPFFHRYTVEEVEDMFINAGFQDVQVLNRFHPVNKAEMLMRMSAGAASLFIFGGEYAENISEEERNEIVQIAAAKLQSEKPELLDMLDQQPTGEPIPVFIGKKTRNFRVASCIGTIVK